jgi:hypothetical protein
VTNPENNPFIQLRPCWAGRAALRRPLPRFSPRLAGVALRRPRRAVCAAMIAEALNWRSRRNTESKARCALRKRKFRGGHISSPRHASGTSVSREAPTKACPSLSADGNIAIVGGPGDNPWDRSVPLGLGAAGAAWVFTRSGSVWTQQGNKLVGTGAMGSARQGMSVALSADGNIAIVGGVANDGGAASVFTRSGGHWTQDERLVGTGAVGTCDLAINPSRSFGTGRAKARRIEPCAGCSCARGSAGGRA